MRPVLVVMVKAPRPGRVKTRLGRQIGMVPAAWWYRHQCAALLRRLRDPRWDILLAVTPDRAPGARIWPERLTRIPQGGGDLGQRMVRLLKRPGARAGGVGRRGDGPVCLIGSDIPGIAPRHIARAFAALGDHDAVFGPAEDGGFWLVGAKHPRRLPRQAFAAARWSTEHALSDSLATLAGFRIALADTLYDVDCSADLRREPVFRRGKRPGK